LQRGKGLLVGVLIASLELNYVRTGGDPTGTGKGGMSIYGECFEDEIHDDLKHTGEPMYLAIIDNCQ